MWINQNYATPLTSIYLIQKAHLKDYCNKSCWIKGHSQLFEYEFNTTVINGASFLTKVV